MAFYRGSAKAGEPMINDFIELVRWAFENTNLNRVEIVASTMNFASLRVAEKAGAVREGVLRRRLLLHGVTHDAMVFSFVRTDFEKV